jgi:hypothetical protein
LGGGGSKERKRDIVVIGDAINPGNNTNSEYRIYEVRKSSKKERKA